MKERKIVGYTRSFKSEKSTQMQIKMISRFCERTGVELKEIFSDEEKSIYSHRKDLIELGTATYVKYPKWENLVEQIAERNIEMLIVESKLRLAVSADQLECFEVFCKSKNTQIVEVCNDIGDEAAVVVYHSLNSPRLRFSIPLQEIDRIYELADNKFVGKACKLYLDWSLYRKENLEIALSDRSASVMLVSSLYHINRKTKTMLGLSGNIEIPLVSVKEGEIKLIGENDSEMTRKRLKVAVYEKSRSAGENELGTEVINHYIKSKTDWQIVGWYVESGRGQSKQSFAKLCNDAGKYDTVFVRSFMCLGDDISNFMEVIKQLKVPVYSMMEGELYVKDKR